MASPTGSVDDDDVGAGGVPEHSRGCPMTTWAGMGTNGNAGPVARLQAELEAVEGELVLARAEITRLIQQVADDGSRLAVAEYELLVKTMTIIRLKREAVDQERRNIASRRSLCEQSDRYKAERDEARALVPETLVCW